MTKLITVKQGEWGPLYQYCEALENGDILFFKEIPFPFAQEHIQFLLQQKQGASRGRKNIAYKPQIDQITNHDSKDLVAASKLKEALSSYSKQVTSFLSILLSPYAKYWRHDYASFRPFQEKGRKLRIRARNDLLHCDAFPTRPLHGARILRFFTNINPTESRKWITSKGFHELAQEFAEQVGIPRSAGYDLKSRLEKKMKQMLRNIGFRMPLRSPYDQFMLKMHHFLKENSTFQANCPKDHWDFPPNSCWAVFTDQVSHAALAGQYALEQTFIIPQHTLLRPEKSPIAILEQLSGHNLIDTELLSS